MSYDIGSISGSIGIPVTAEQAKIALARFHAITSSDGVIAKANDIPDMPKVKGALRNAKCGCGSGKKFKKCCLPRHNTYRNATINVAREKMISQVSQRIDVGEDTAVF